MRVGITATRQGLAPLQAVRLYRVLKALKGTDPILAHGDCVGGDAQAHTIARWLEYDIIVYPGNMDKLRAFCEGDVVKEPKRNLDRNKDIVEFCGVLIVLPNGFTEQIRSGTWSTFRYARSVKKPLVVIYPDGTEKRRGWETLEELVALIGDEE